MGSSVRSAEDSARTRSVRAIALACLTLSCGGKGCNDPEVPGTEVALDSALADAAPPPPPKPRCRATAKDTVLGKVLETGRLTAWGDTLLLPVLRAEKEAEILRLSRATLALEGSEWRGAARDAPELVVVGPRVFATIGEPGKPPTVSLVQGGQLQPPPDVESHLTAAFVQGGTRSLATEKGLVQWLPGVERDAGLDPAHAVERAAEDPIASVIVRFRRSAADASTASETLLLGRAGALDLALLADGRALVVYTDARSARGQGGRLRAVTTGGKPPRTLVAAHVMPEFVAVFTEGSSAWAFFSIESGALSVVPFSESADIGVPSREPALEHLAILGSVAGSTGLSLLAAELETGRLHLVQCER